MAYTPTVWQAGDTVTAAKLNKMEQGIASGGGVYVVNITTVGDNTQQLDKTAAEIWAAAQSSMVIGRSNEGDMIVIAPMTMARQQIDGSNHYYSFMFADTDFSTDSDSGYPSYESVPQPVV